MSKKDCLSSNKIVILIFLIMIGVLSSCERLKTGLKIEQSSGNTHPSDKIYFSLERDGSAMIWVSKIDDLYKGQYSFDELYRHSKQNSIWILPNEVLAMFLPSYCKEDNYDITNKSVSYGISELLLSPDKKELAWEDGYSVCVGTGSGSCMGEIHLKIRNVDKRSEPRVLLSVPSSLDLRLYGYKWSPNGQQIGYIIGGIWEGWERVRAVNVLNGVITDYGEGKRFEWSPKGDKIAIVSKTDSSKFPGYREDYVRVTALDGTTIVNIKNEWAKINDISWSQDGTRIAVAATLLEGDVSYSDRSIGKGAEIFIANILKDGPITKVIDNTTIQTLGISVVRWSITGKWIAVVSLDDHGGIGRKSYVIDLENDNASLIIGGEDVARGYNNPSWSPKEDILAVSTYDEDTPQSGGIAIFDPADGTIVSTLSAWIKHDNWNVNDIWEWDSTGESLLVLIGDSKYLCSSEKPQDLGIYHWRENVLDRISSKIYPTFQKDFEECNTYLLDATW